jgi:hypothetical protein
VRDIINEEIESANLVHPEFEFKTGFKLVTVSACFLKKKLLNLTNKLIFVRISLLWTSRLHSRKKGCPQKLSISEKLLHYLVFYVI